MTTALIVIDVQEEYFGGMLPIEYPPRTDSLDLIGRAMDAATAAGVPVAVVRHTGVDGQGPFQADSTAWQLRPRSPIVRTTCSSTSACRARSPGRRSRSGSPSVASTT